MNDYFEKLLEAMPETTVCSPTNTLAHIFNHDYKENFISDWLAFLINPDFMGTFEPVNNLLSLAKAEPLEEAQVVIEREYVFTEDGRRIDFYIETEDAIIGIENKIFSSLRNNQLKSYKTRLSKEAEKSGKALILILLYPQKNKEVSRIVAQQKLYDFIPITYEALIEAFRKVRVDFISNVRAAFLMQDFITHMEEYIMSDNKTDAINFEMLAFARTKESELAKLKENLKKSEEQFTKMIEAKYAEYFPDSEWDVHSSTSSTWFQLYKNSWDRRIVHFEIMATDDNGKKQIFPPHTLTVVLHSHEAGKNVTPAPLFSLGKTDVENYLCEKYGSSSFDIDYESEEAFNDSISNVFTAMTDIVEKFTPIVDSLL